MGAAPYGARLDVPCLHDRGADRARRKSGLPAHTRSDHSAPIELRQADARRTGGSLLVIRLGLWRESIDSNRASAAARKEYFAKTGTEAVWDQTLHAMDYHVADEVCSSSSTNPRGIDRVRGLLEPGPEPVQRPVRGGALLVLGLAHGR